MKSRLLGLLALLPLAAQGADPGDPPDSMAWRCWYDQEIHITCLVETLPRAGTAMEFPPYLPAVVQQLRRNPEAFRGRFIHIPLHSQPEEMEFAAELAQAIVCGSRPNCTVNFSAIPLSPGEIDDLLQKNPRPAGLDGQAGLPDTDEDR